MSGHPLLRVPSAREAGGIHVVVFKQQVLSNVRDYCNLRYVYDLTAEQISVYRDKEALAIDVCIADEL